MEFKKCNRCGCFFISEDEVCCNCKTKDMADTIKIQNYIQEYGIPGTAEELSEGTGVTIKNIYRFGGIEKLDENINPEFRIL